MLMPYGLAARQAAIAAYSAHDADRAACTMTRRSMRPPTFLRDLVLRTPPNAGSGFVELRASCRGSAERLSGLDLETQRVDRRLVHEERSGFPQRSISSMTWSRAAFAFDGIVGAYASPFMPGTAYVLLHHCFGEVNGKAGRWGHAVGGMGAIRTAIAAAARDAGAEIRTDAAVARIEAPMAGRRVFGLPTANVITRAGGRRERAAEAAVPRSVEPAEVDPDDPRPRSLNLAPAPARSG